MKNRTHYYFDGITKFEDFVFYISIDDKSYELHWFIIFYITLWFMFHKIDGFIRVYDGSRYLVLFVLEEYDAIYNRIRYLILLVKKVVSQMFFSFLLKNLCWFLWFFSYRKNIDIA